MTAEPLTFSLGLYFFFKISFILFAVLYFIFSLIVVRQIAEMTKTVITASGGIIRFISFFYALFALGLVVAFVYLL